MTYYHSMAQPDSRLKSEWICQFCMKDMGEDQVFCCDTYKGKMSKFDFIAYYGDELDELQFCQTYLIK